MTFLDGFVGLSAVMPGLVLGIHVFLASKTWMAGHKRVHARLRRRCARP
jgi:hypothetical protein